MSSDADTKPMEEPKPAREKKPDEIKIVSHSTLFYWWPVWAAAAVFFVVSYFSGDRMIIVPSEGNGTIVEQGRIVEGREKLGHRDIVILPEKSKALRDKDDPEKIAKLKVHVAQSKNVGIFFFTILLLVIIITNVPLRGLWSVLVIGLVIFLSIIFALMGWWDTIFGWLWLLDIRINAGGYAFMALALFVMWAVVVFWFDRQIYLIFTAGQLRVRLEIGEGETAYDTRGMVIHKERNDIFRHWILGLGSGDLRIRTSGAQAHEFDLPNVLFLGRQVRQIEDLMRRAGTGAMIN